jgi:hypothetical protein
MYLRIRIIFLGAYILTCSNIYSQNIEQRNRNSIEIGLGVAGAETLFYGLYGKYSLPLSQMKHHFTFGLALNVFNDFKGESTNESFLKNDVDMRIIPSLNFGYSLNFKRFQLNLELPVGASVAITQGTLVNRRIGFERDYSNKEIFWYYGLSFLPKYRIDNNNQIGLFLFMPLASDKTQSGYQVGIGWTRKIGTKAGK